MARKADSAASPRARAPAPEGSPPAEAPGPTDPAGNSVSEGAAGLEAEADPELEELKAFLAEAGVALRPLAEVEQALVTAAAAPAEELPAASGRRAEAPGSRRAAEASTFQNLDEHLRAEPLEILVSDDRLMATIPRLGPENTRAQVVAALKARRICHGLRAEAVNAALVRAAAGEEVRDVTAARGTAPEPGADSTFEWAIAVGGRAGTILADGSIDLRDRRLVTVVKEGQALGRLLPARSGKPGKDVLGHERPAAPVATLEVATDSHIAAGPPDADGAVPYSATAAGGVYRVEETREGRGGRRRRLKIGINPVSKIDGDVDYSTGHIDFQGDVLIEGSVRALFQVRASGSVTVGGNVEPGARVRAGTDLVVAGGILGVDTEIAAGGNVMAKFVQQATLRAGGDVEVGAYVHEASVRARGQIRVAGAGEGSGRALVGGLVWAGKGIEAPSLGSASNPKIRLVAGVDPDLVDRAEKARAQLKALEDKQQKLLEALGVPAFDPRLIKQRLKAADGDRRKVLVRGVQKLTEVGEAHKHLREQLAEIAEAQRQLALQARIEVAGTIFAGPQLRIGEQQLRVAEDARGGRYALVEEDGQRRIERLQV